MCDVVFTVGSEKEWVSDGFCARREDNHVGIFQLFSGALNLTSDVEVQNRCFGLVAIDLAVSVHINERD